MLGPLEVIVIEFKGNKFRGEIAPALREIVERDIIRIIDLTFIKKDQEGNVTAFELFELDPEEAAVFDPIAWEIQGLFSDEDVTTIADSMANNTSSALLLFEHVWASRFKEAVIKADGRVSADYRIPPEYVDQLIREAARSTI